ncbi:MAG: redox-sensing transcriptional repressor Rex, partial [Firmicutes bacterium]|nr:redox-sensing transcriptional repressor Rex [Bacillota bacterium]
QAHEADVDLGKLGQALARYNIEQHTEAGARMRAAPDRLRITAIFDVDPSKVGGEYVGIPIFHVDELRTKIRELSLKIMVIAVPAQHAQAVASECALAGVRAILNFAPAKLALPPEVRVHSTDLTLELQSLAFYTE